MVGTNFIIVVPLMTLTFSSRIVLLDPPPTLIWCVALYAAASARTIVRPLESTAVEAGLRVVANHQGLGCWHSGVVRDVGTDGACSVAYDDGSVESSVPAGRIRLLIDGDPKEKTFS